MESFGGQTVTFISRVPSGAPDELGVMTLVETRTDVAGCHHRGLNLTETAELAFDIATEVFKTTAPPHPAVLAAKPTDVIECDGIRYQIIAGARPHPDFGPDPFKATILSTRHIG